MTGGELASLKWVADFVRAVLSSVTADRIKPLSSEKRARRRIFALYSALGEVVIASDGVIATLRRSELEIGRPDRRYVRKPSFYDWGDSEQIPQTAVDLEFAIEDLAVSLRALRWAIEGLAPQLDIHAPELLDEIEDAFRARRDVGRAASMYFSGLTTNQADLIAVRRAAERARGEVAVTTECVRGFIADQFPFKDLF